MLIKVNRLIDSSNTTYGVFLFLLVAIFLTFSKALSCYFTADDFWHLPLLYKTFNQSPIYLFENFWGPWANKSNLYLFYRPLTELSLALDYMIYRGNPFGYHLSNLIYHWINACLVFVLSKEAIGQFHKEKEASYYPLIASIMVALLFAIHPINTAPVVWILARADLVGSLLSLATVLFLWRFLNSENRSKYYLSILFFSLALLAKESSATIALIATCLFAVSSYTKLDRNKFNLDSFLSLVITAFKQARLFWLILAVYLLIRTLALGDFLGGYVGTTSHILNETQLTRIFSPLSYWKILHPFNVEIFDSSSKPELALRILYMIMGLIVVSNTLFTNSLEKQSRIVFGSLFVVCILLCVNMPVWHINDMLHGSRMAYIIAAPIALILVSLLIPYAITKIEALLFRLGLLVLTLFTSTLCLISYINTTAWDKSSSSIRVLKTEIVSKLNTLDSNKSLAVYNMPQFVKGTFVFFTTDYVSGLLQPPLTKRDFSKRFICLDGPFIQSAGINAQALQSVLHNNNIELARWNKASEKIELLDKANLLNLEEKQINYGSRKLSIKPIGSFAKEKGKNKSSAQKVFLNKVPGNDIKSYLVETPIPFAMPNQVILSIELSTTNDTDSKSDLLRQLQEVNQFLQEGSTLTISWQDTNVSNKPIEFHFRAKDPVLKFQLPIFENTQLTLKPCPQVFRIDLGSNNLNLLSVSLDSQLANTPQLLLASKSQFLTNGSQKPESNLVLFDFNIEAIEKARAIRYEVSKPNYQFEILKGSNDIEKSKAYIDLSRLIQKQSGMFEVNTNKIKGLRKGSFIQVRAIALDANKEKIGTYSTPITITPVDK